ncbi:hypothetical protein DENIS_2112 [Desulfonema ishimotonii]|uniref:FunZ protein n=1 Tax=Desulfonema ishimotonii TaxID=45657 RepID=A0A401FW00_9BACT|nr:funZ protein [Desulfonema ishimotonii]GBC61152.1 hypothetical protein DENIS_2112 [Desulfonema ishimotonii]
MLKINDLNLGFNDAENYQRRENKELFNSIFVKNKFLDELLQPSSFFLIGEKGTGKTAYSVFLSNNEYKDTLAELKYIRETDYQKFVSLKKNKHLELSDYSNIWMVIILLLLANSIQKDELDHNPFSKNQKIKSLMQAIEEYYLNAFSPEIISVLNLVENSKITAELITKHLKFGGEEATNANFQESKFQVNLLYIQKQFERAISDIKIKKNHLLFIDGIDIRPGTIPYADYLDCVKGLANAIWCINNDFFANIKDSKGRFRAILLVRPDIFNSIGLQNLTNKIHDNSVFLDWRTTYPNYRHSNLFELLDKLLGAQQNQEKLDFGNAWDHYFPWKSASTNRNREHDPSFYKFLRLSYSRPRDIVTMIQILREEYFEKKYFSEKYFPQKLFDSYEFQNKFSEYLMGGIKDQLSFYYNTDDYSMFLKFFNFLNGKQKFDYSQYVEAYNKFTDYVLEHHTDIPEFIETSDSFLQFLYDTNIICYIEELEYELFFRWCYRERSPSNISPKIRPESKYRIHYGLHKALNVGNQGRKKA